jgi:Zn-dependent peptidase ImmA (M78 family)
MKEFKAPFLDYEKIRSIADQFLDEHHTGRELPIPIDEIIEFDYGINIIPLLGLQREFEVDGFTSSDLTNIYVDEYVYDNLETRYRFTLAHELGHIVLHGDLYQSINHRNIKEWREFVSSIPEKEHSFLEYHAYCFGGLVLVPREPLIAETTRCIQMIKQLGVPLRNNWDFAWELIASFLGKTFKVSSEVVEKRIEKDQIKNMFLNQK